MARDMGLFWPGTVVVATPPSRQRRSTRSWPWRGVIRPRRSWTARSRAALRTPHRIVKPSHRAPTRPKADAAAMNRMSSLGFWNMVHSVPGRCSAVGADPLAGEDAALEEVGREGDALGLDAVDEAGGPAAGLEPAGGVPVVAH